MFVNRKKADGRPHLSA